MKIKDARERFKVEREADPEPPLHLFRPHAYTTYCGLSTAQANGTRFHATTEAASFSIAGSACQECLVVMRLYRAPPKVTTHLLRPSSVHSFCGLLHEVGRTVPHRFASTMPEFEESEFPCPACSAKWR